MRRSPLAVLAVITSSACAGADDGARALGACGEGSRLDSFSFYTDALETGSEAYLCFGFDAAPLAGRSVTRVAWSPPRRGGLTLHHATLYATRASFPAGPTPCEEMPPDSVGLHIWAPGDGALVLPSGIALSIPPETAHLVVQAHFLRTDTTPAEEASVDVCSTNAAPAHVAAWFSAIAPVPAIRPHHQETATTRCRVGGRLQALFVWPHMHLLGKEFHGSIERADGGVTPLVDVVDWDFQNQRTYPIAVGIEAGDVIDIACTWQNDGPDYVFPGPKTTDEMCTQGLVAWPAESAHCSPL